MTFLVGAVPMITIYMVIASGMSFKSPTFQIHAFFILLSIPLWFAVFIAKDIYDHLKEKEKKEEVKNELQEDKK